MPQDCRTGRCLEVDNMRILVLGFSKMKFMPYASFYIDRIDCNINEVEVLLPTLFGVSVHRAIE